MAKYKDVIDLYDDNGKLLKSNVALEKISPLVNPAVKKIIDDTKRTVAVNLGGMQEALKTGKIGKHQQILGRELNLDIVGNIDAIEAKIKEYVSVEAGDDTVIKRYNGGKLLLVKVPSSRIAAAATYDAALTSVAAATTYAVVEQFNVDMFNANTVKAAAYGTYPVTMDMAGGACS
ncbi:MAG TPA: methyl-coenzyme M reductase subunit beta, partial [Methanocorpusculum sp.]|nr:methyl-coenzyme M reductase subunit beta [Methanocorpusculum sp.]